MEISLLPHQLEFIESKAEHTLMVCGRGAGKSFVLGIKVCQLLSEGKSVLVCTTDYRNLRYSTMKSIIEAMDLMGISYQYNKSDYIISALGQTVYGISGEAWEKARGLTNISALVIDEAALIKEEAIPVMAACLRGQSFDPDYYYASTPRGKTGKSKWFYELSKKEDTHVIHATSRDNYSVQEGYHDSMEKLYGKTAFAKQELGGAFIDYKAGILDSSWFEGKEVEVPAKLPTRNLVRAYDLAVTKGSHGDYTASFLLGYDRESNLFTIYDIQRWKAEWPETKKKIIDQAYKDGGRVAIYVEAFATQKGLVQDLQRSRELKGFSIKGITPKGDKMSKAMPFAGEIAQGNVLINRNIEIIQDYYTEMNEFDGSDDVHDDMIDAGALAYFALKKSIPARAINQVKGLY